MKKLVILAITIGILLTGQTAYAAAVPSFKDIPAGYASRAVVDWATGNRVASGFSDGTFRPDKPVSQADFLNLLLRAYQIKLPAGKTALRYAIDRNWAVSASSASFTKGNLADILAGVRGVSCTRADNVSMLTAQRVITGTFNAGAAVTRIEALAAIRAFKLQVPAVKSKPAVRSTAVCPSLKAAAPQGTAGSVGSSVANAAPLAAQLPGTAGLTAVQSEAKQTYAGITLDGRSTTDSSALLTGSFESPTRLWIRVLPASGAEKDAVDWMLDVKQSFSQKLYFPQGAGTYTVRIATAPLDSASNRYTVLTTFKMDNKDTADRDYLLPSAMIQSTDAAIVKLARSITSGLTSDLDKTKAIHDWVASHISYAISGGVIDSRNFSALETLTSKRAVCNGYARLAVALNRAVGIKARFVTGQIINPSQGQTWANTPRSENHAWLQTYANGAWIVQDPTWDAGYVSGGEFTSKPGDSYFNPKAAAFAADHKTYTITNE